MGTDMDNLTTRLEGSIVVLEPLGEEHAEELWEAAQAPEIWAWLAHIGSSREYFDMWLDASIEAARSGREGPFATRDLRSGKAIGSSRYLNVRPHDRVVEIGWTWLHPSAWGTGANVEAKLVQLQHAFEEWRCRRVEFKTDASNERSRGALSALGAAFEGVHRKHMLVRGGENRDSAWFSVTDDDWPAVHARLVARLAEK